MELWGRGSLCAPGIAVAYWLPLGCSWWIHKTLPHQTQCFTGKWNWILRICAISERKGAQDSHKLGLNHCSLSRTSDLKWRWELSESFSIILWGAQTAALWWVRSENRMVVNGVRKGAGPGQCFYLAPVTQANHQWPDSCCQIPTRSMGTFAKPTV